MSRQFRVASAVCIAASLATILFSTGGSGAKAQDIQIPVAEAPGSSAITVEPHQSVFRPAEQPLPQPERVDPENDREGLPSAATLADLIERTPLPASLSREMECLAGAIYFEARSETLAGQLAVGRVIVTRAASGRFPSSYCGVVYQPSQFSFIRANTMPAVNHDSRLWQQAVKIALIADSGTWKSPVEGAMFFHAAHVAPSWGKTRMARVDNHVFYR
ncbi:cell wall hydrolase [Novosphingobium sp. PASSN1]|uniref:cell wall hydrolase n=1 Tax=Novosphingobium sp. PASSN1 TaxID=2015561 RepID=UPI000BD10254|nr:cell wall hydrolase [Novosphingobium sp. PASSN1]OYU36578.1 MAG: cell wall hydrolase [Novosphingobium sp. PASSN1]